MTDKAQKITKLIDIESLHNLQYRISATSDVIAVMLDPRGEPVTRLADLAEFCHVREETDGHSCRQIHTRLFQQVCDTHDIVLDHCPHAGLSAAALPIFHEGELICIWILCQFQYISDPLIAQPLSMNATDYLSPILNRASLTLLQDFITTLTEDVIQLGKQNNLIREMEESSKRLAFQDRLLGIPNYLCLERDLSAAKRSCHLIVLSVADLRKINNAYGRDRGNLLLHAVRDYIQDLKIPGSKLYRLDSSGFGILLKGYDNPEAEQVAHHLSKRCAQAWPLQVEGRLHNVFTTVNVGVMPIALPFDNINNITTAIQHILDIAGMTNGVAVIDSKKAEQFRDRIKLEFLLRQSVRENMRGFGVVYQPIVDPSLSMWQGVEALCRWEAGDFGVVPPSEFIQIAESSGLINTIGRWVLEQSIRQVKAWKLDREEHFLLHVNLSPIQLVDPDLDQVVLQVIRQYDYPPEKLCLEITETNELNFSQYSLEILHQLSDTGVTVALDDFGTGYASYNSLHKLPIKVVKTDRALLHGVETDSFLKRLFYVLVEMAHASDLKVVAEGVETELQASYLMKLGVDYFQGYLFSHPLTVSEIEQRMSRFYVPSEDILQLGCQRIELSKLVEKGYELSPDVYKLLISCMQMLCAPKRGEKSIEAVLGLVGQTFHLSHCSLFRFNGADTFTRLYTWCAPGSPSTKRGSAIQSHHPGRVSAWIDTLNREGVFVASDINTLDCATAQFLHTLGSRAVAVIPIWRDSRLEGFLGMEHCLSVHNWTQEEVQVLYTLTEVFAGLLENS